MSRHHYNNHHNNGPLERATCTIPDQLRFPSYSFFSDPKSFLAVTGGDAPWYFPTRNSAMANSKGFYHRFLQNLGKVMTKYCDEIEEYNNSKKNKETKKTDEDEEEEVPQLPSELRRLCAYVASSFTAQRLFENPEIKSDLSDLLNDPRVQKNQAIWKIFSSCPMIVQGSSNNNSTDDKNNSAGYQSSVTSAVTSTGRISSAKLALLQQKEGDGSVASAASGATTPTTTPTKKAGTLSLTSLKKAPPSALAVPAPKSQQQTTTAATTTAEQLEKPSPTAADQQQQQTKVTLSPDFTGGDQLQWADATLEHLTHLLGSAASSSSSRSSRSDRNNKSSSAASPSSSTSSSSSYLPLLLRLVNEIGYFISGHETWVRNNFFPELATEWFWGSKSALLANILAKSNNNINDNDNDALVNEDDEFNNNNNQDEDNNDNGDDDDQNYLEKRANAKTASMMGGRTATLVSDAGSNNPMLKNQVPRYFAPVGKPGIEICPHLMSSPPTKMENTNSASENNNNNNNNNIKEQEQYWSAHQALLQGALASNIRFQGFTFPSLKGAPNNISQSELYKSILTDNTEQQQSSHHESAATMTAEEKLRFESIVAPLRTAIEVLGNKRLFLDPQMNINVPKEAKKTDSQEKEDNNNSNNTKSTFEPNIHSKVNCETVKLNKRIEWEKFQLYLVVLTQLCLDEAKDACWALARFMQIYEKAKIVSGHVFRSLRSYEFDVDHGRACAKIGDRMEEKTLLNKDFLRGTALALMRQKPFLVWLGADVVTDWLTYCWVRWTSLEDEANRLVFGELRDDEIEDAVSSTDSFALHKKRKVIRNEQRLRFIELARELKKEAKERFGGKNNNTNKTAASSASNSDDSSSIPRVWVPVTSAELFCLDRREFPHSIVCPCISELDVAVVDVSSALPPDDEDTNNNDNQTFFPAVKVELVLEIKYSPTDLIKASNQEVVFSRALAQTIKENDDRYRGFIRLGTSAKEGEIAYQNLADLGHVAFGCDDLPDLVQIRTVMDEIRVKGGGSKDGRDNRRGGGRNSRNNNNNKKEDEEAKNNNDDDGEQQPKQQAENEDEVFDKKQEKKKQQLEQFVKSIRVPPKYSEVLKKYRETKDNKRSSSAFATSGFALTIESFGEWAIDEAKTRFVGNNTPKGDPSLPRFFLVSTWPTEKDGSLTTSGAGDRTFPVYAPMKHVVVRSVASLLAKGGWGGVKEDPVTAELLRKSLEEREAAQEKDDCVLVGENTKIEISTTTSPNTSSDINNSCYSPLFPPPPSSSQLVFFSKNDSNINSSDDQKEDAVVPIKTPSAALITDKKGGNTSIRRNYFTELFTRVICHGILHPKLKSKKSDRDYRYRGLTPALKKLAKDIDLDNASPLSGDEIANRVYFQDFIAAVSSVNFMWQKLKSQKGLLSPSEVYQQQYGVKDNILFVRFDKSF